MALSLDRPVVIAGGGIGGLSLALGLSRAGVPCRVFERAPNLTPVGAGLSLWANATSGLDRLGVLSTLERHGASLRELHVLNPKGVSLSHATMPKQRTPALGVLRSVLQQTLLEALPSDVVSTGRTVTHFEENDDHVAVHFSDGTTEAGSLLVGADGVRSQVRMTLHGQPLQRFAGYLCWRGVARFRLAQPEGVFSEYWGRGRRFGILPCGQGLLYWYATLNAAPGEAPRLAGNRERVLEEFGAWHEPVRELIQATPPEAILCHDLEDHPPLKQWGRGRVLVLGDAAHAMLPNLGQGGGTAIEDAVTLATLLSSRKVEEAHLRAWEKQRQKRTREIQLQAFRVGQAGQLAQPVAVWLRDLSLRLTPKTVAAAAISRFHRWTPEAT